MEFINYPVVCNLAEAEMIADEFDSVVSLVRSEAKTLLRHRRRCFVPFDDVITARDGSAASHRDIRKILKFAAEPSSPILIHCQYGQSRSTAVALGILVTAESAPPTILGSGVRARIRYTGTILGIWTSNT